MADHDAAKDGDCTPPSNNCEYFIKRLAKYSTEDKQKLGKRCAEFKVQYDEEMAVTPSVWDAKRKKHVKRQPKEGFISRAVREHFSSLQEVKSTDPQFRKAVSLANRCYENQKKLASGDVDPPTSKRTFRQPGGGRKSVAPEVRQAAFEWFIDVRGTLKGRLPRKLFRLKCKELYEQWAQAQTPVPEQPLLQFSDRWINSWMQEYRVSLNKPSKRFALSQNERIVRIVDFLKNVYRVRYYFYHHFGKEPVIINGDQMPLHRNESASSKTMTLTGQHTYVKENYMLARERVTVFTQVSTDEENMMPIPEFVFKGKGTRTNLNPPVGVEVQWAAKGSYRIETMLGTINNMKNRSDLFGTIRGKNFAIYILDDYSVHVTEEVRKALLARGYILVIIGGGITGDIQVNDTHIHHILKKEYREKEAALMLEQLNENPNKIPQPSRDDMMKMIKESWESIEIDPRVALKHNFVTNAFDGSEDYLVTDKLFEIVGCQILAFRAELTSTPPPATVKELVKTITPPKGVKIKTTNADVPTDEGYELLDCDGEELDERELTEEFEYHSDAEENVENFTQNAPASMNTKSVSPLSTATSTSGTVVSEVSIVSLTPFADPEVKMDTEFLDDMQNLFSKHTTSKLFIPYMCNFKAIFSRARRSLKKRLLSKHSFSKIQDDSNGRGDSGEADSDEDDMEMDTVDKNADPATSTGRSLLSKQSPHWQYNSLKGAGKGCSHQQTTTKKSCLRILQKTWQSQRPLQRGHVVITVGRACCKFLGKTSQHTGLQTKNYAICL